ncbi:MAG: hypothetical protein K8H88_23290, partial [Sandaracinaceae bacterium]|nr:hypothetical protein [Sandaracinaceae bacterium]
MTLRATLLALIIFPLAARAQDGCFDVSGQSGARSTHLVGLHDVVRLQPGCEYALAEGGPWAPPGALAGRDTDFADLYETLARAQAPSGEPRVVLARRTGRRDATTQSLMLRYCAHYLLEEQLGFRVVPSSDGSSFRVERVSPAGCDAGRVELRALRSARSEQLTAASADQTLGASQSSLTLPQGDWSLYAARPGGRVGLRVGVFRAQRVFTPLSARLRATSEASPLFAAVWEPGAPGLLL